MSSSSNFGLPRDVIFLLLGEGQAGVYWERFELSVLVDLKGNFDLLLIARQTVVFHHHLDRGRWLFADKQGRADIKSLDVLTLCHHLAAYVGNAKNGRRLRDFTLMNQRLAGQVGKVLREIIRVLAQEHLNQCLPCGLRGGWRRRSLFLSLGPKAQF